MDYDRQARDTLNTPSSPSFSRDWAAPRLLIFHDPNSKHLGTTVWDASMVFAKFLEKNSRKGRFCPSKLKGKRAIELGAGCGLAGLGMALLGCDVVTTDQVEVLPLLMRNVERNKSWIAQSNPDSGSFGSVTVAELDWGNKEHIRAVEPPFDYIIGTDVVYSEHLLQPLLETIIALSGPKTKVLLGYEIRSTTVHEQMMEMWKINFNVKTISKSKMDAKYQHPSINLYMMDLKASSVPEAEPNSNGSTEEEEEDDASNPGEDEDTGVKDEPCTASKEDVDDWEIRRSGAMAARLLKDVRLT
ncbi:protein N-lysine methyltransferase METTL21A [Hordeum vulgare]|nr:protein N-lysine methyltransferase METTL21A [Hordeum vulgare]